MQKVEVLDATLNENIQDKNVTGKCRRNAKETQTTNHDDDTHHSMINLLSRQEIEARIRDRRLEIRRLQSELTRRKRSRRERVTSEKALPFFFASDKSKEAQAGEDGDEEKGDERSDGDNEKRGEEDEPCVVCAPPCKRQALYACEVCGDTACLEGARMEGRFVPEWRCDGCPLMVCEAPRWM